MSKATSEDESELATDEALPEAEAEAIVESDDEVFTEETDEEGNPPVTKKVVALKARRRLEDYLEEKRIQDELDYLDDEQKRKNALLQKIALIEKQEKQVKHVKPKPEKPLKIIEKPPVIVAPEAIKESPKAIAKTSKSKAKPAPKPKPKSKPQKAKVVKKTKPKHKIEKKASGKKRK